MFSAFVRTLLSAFENYTTLSDTSLDLPPGESKGASGMRVEILLEELNVPVVSGAKMVSPFNSNDWRQVMKNLIWRLYLMAALTALALAGRTTPTFAAEDRSAPVDQLERLERRVNEMAGRQEQFVRQMSTQLEQQGAMARGGPENMRQPMPPPQGFRPPMLPAGAPPAAKHLKGIGDALFLIGIICNILMAIWIFTDIRKRGDGPAIFVAMALVAGIPAALIYSLVRLGDKKV
jgi:hypothetical protein